MKKLFMIFHTPWKLVTEIHMYILKPVAILYCLFFGVKLGRNSKFYGLPAIFKYRPSKIVFGKNFENRNWMKSNPLGINHPTIFTTWEKNAEIIIGNNVGISGGAICAATKVVIGDNTIIGANCTIADTDFHPIQPTKRRHSKKNINSKPILIGNNVFVGMNSTILKGVIIGDNSVVGAGSTVRKNISKNSIYINGKSIKIL